MKKLLWWVHGSDCLSESREGVEPSPRHSIGSSSKLAQMMPGVFGCLHPRSPHSYRPSIM
jgi:hypothetical protein